MWGLGIVVGLVGIGLTLYELATRPSAREKQLAVARQNSRVSNLGAAPEAPPPLRGAGIQHAIKCGLRDGDWAATDAWTRSYNLPSSTPVLARLQLMVSIVPQFNWPQYARNVYCTYVGN